MTAQLKNLIQPNTTHLNGPDSTLKKKSNSICGNLKLGFMSLFFTEMTKQRKELTCNGDDDEAIERERERAGSERK